MKVINLRTLGGALPWNGGAPHFFTAIRDQNMRIIDSEIVDGFIKEKRLNK